MNQLWLETSQSFTASRLCHQESGHNLWQMCSKPQENVQKLMKYIMLATYASQALDYGF